MHPDLLDAAQGWIRDDPDADDRAELGQLVASGDAAALAERFAGPLQFGTAGIRGPMRAGPSGMNTATVTRTAAGLGRFLGLDARVVVGFDGRHRSRTFATVCAEVLAGAGCAVALIDDPVPTPLLAFSVRHRSASAGVMITASHNPARDNGLKVYLGASELDGAAFGAQIAPPTDREIEEVIGRVGPAADVLRQAPGRLRADGLIESYLAAVLAASSPNAERGKPEPGELERRGLERRGLGIAYTPLHGVGRSVLTEALIRAGFRTPDVVREQADPDGDFPTVPFPNPEAPGALDRLIALGTATGADLAIASDPDADRCAAVVGERVLTGDEIGCLLGDALLRRRPGPVATSLVSSTLLPVMAERAGVPCHVTRTGFKWLMRADPELVFAYEEALGYAVAPSIVRDKDGISAALLLAEVAEELRQQGRSLLDRLDELALEFGLHLTRGVSVRYPGADGADRAAKVTAALHSDPPRELAGRPVRSAGPLGSGAGTLTPVEGIAFRFDDGRVLVRPSGTEPLLKAYLELVRPIATSVAEEREQGLRDLDDLARAVRAVLDPGGQASN